MAVRAIPLSQGKGGVNQQQQQQQELDIGCRPATNHPDNNFFQEDSLKELANCQVVFVAMRCNNSINHFLASSLPICHLSIGGCIILAFY